MSYIPNLKIWDYLAPYLLRVKQESFLTSDKEGNIGERKEARKGGNEGERNDGKRREGERAGREGALGEHWVVPTWARVLGLVRGWSAGRSSGRRLDEAL